MSWLLYCNLTLYNKQVRYDPGGCIMNLRKKQIATLLCTTTLLLVGFQNCSPTNMKFSQAVGVDELSSVVEPGGEVGINNPSEEEPGGENPPSSEPPVVTNPPVESPEEAAYNRFTSIGQGAYLLSCGKTIKSITSIQAGAKVILVNADLNSLTSLDRDAELVLVNAQLKKVTSVQGRLIQVTEDAEKQKWIDLCAAEDKYEALAAGASAFSINTINAGNAAIVPRAASSYAITVISSGAVLDSVHASGLFSVTQMSEGVSLSVKSKNIRMTSLSKGARLILHNH
jgi:hypothetical protein